MTRHSGNAGERRVRRFLRAFAADPVEALLHIPEELSRRSEHPVDQRVDEDWEARLHAALGAPWPCPEAARAAELWSTVAEELHGDGLEFGRHTYGVYSDADQALTRAAWCTVVHLRPKVVVETGVARGTTSRAVLEAMERNGYGHLWSIDLPNPFEPEVQQQTGAAVPESCRARWTYVSGSSRRRLPQLLRRLGRVDLFVHDSLHTARNTRFEMDRIGRALAPHGVMLVDDISPHQGFAEWTRAEAPAAELICPSDDGEGLFGFVRT